MIDNTLNMVQNSNDVQRPTVKSPACPLPSLPSRPPQHSQAFTCVSFWGLLTESGQIQTLTTLPHTHTFYTAHYSAPCFFSQQHIPRSARVMHKALPHSSTPGPLCQGHRSLNELVSDSQTFDFHLVLYIESPYKCSSTHTVNNRVHCSFHTNISRYISRKSIPT